MIVVAIETDINIPTALAIKTSMAIMINLVSKSNIHLSRIELGVKCKEIVPE